MLGIRALGLLLAVAFGAEAGASPDVQRWTLENGARVYFVETHQLPMVQFMVGFDAGSARDPEGLRGLSRFVSDMLEEGAGALDGQAVAEGFDSVGAVYGGGNGRDLSIFELKSLSEEAPLAQAAEIFADLLRAPSFPPEAMERIRDRLLVGLKRRQQSPGSVASRAFYDELFRDHPYQNPPQGDEAGVSAISREDLIAFHQRYFVGSNAFVTIVGDLGQAQAKRWAQHIVGDLPSGLAPLKLGTPRRTLDQEAVQIPFPSSQTHLVFGQVGIARNDPDYFPLYVGNHILGGSGLVSRLSHEVREERGLTYSVYSYFRPMQEKGPFIINLQTRNDQRGVAEELVLDVVTDFVSNGPTEKELEAAKKNIIGGFPLRIDSNKKIANNLLSIAFYDLPLDYLDTYPDRVSEVTLEQVREAFERRVSPDQLLRIFVGGE